MYPLSLIPQKCDPHQKPQVEKNLTIIHVLILKYKDVFSIAYTPIKVGWFLKPIE